MRRGQLLVRQFSQQISALCGAFYQVEIVHSSTLDIVLLKRMCEMWLKGLRKTKYYENSVIAYSYVHCFPLLMFYYQNLLFHHTNDAWWIMFHFSFYTPVHN